jgi:hypothetical protein
MQNGVRHSLSSVTAFLPQGGGPPTPDKRAVA